MGVYIPSLKMPQTCEDCNLESYCSLWVDARRMSGPWEKGVEATIRHPDCPLVEVKPHGRLIDADELNALYNGEDIDDERYHVSIPCIKQNITDMPTILESDVGECITTNADYIRHMCVEKLAWWLSKICPDAPFAFAYPERSSEELWLSWLKEEEGLYE